MYCLLLYVVTIKSDGIFIPRSLRVIYWVDNIFRVIFEIPGLSVIGKF